MNRYEISYYYDDPWAGTVEETTTFEGGYTEMQDYCKGLKSMGCYGIYAADICPEWPDDCADIDE